MIEPGVCFCPVCGYTSREPFYAADLTEHAAWLRRDPQQGYYMEAYGNPRKIYHLQDPLAPDRDGGMPDAVWVYLNGEKASPTELRRCCPDCFNGAADGASVRSHFKRFVGRVPVRVVALIGAPSAGKTAFLGALGSGALIPLNRQSYPYRLVLSKPNSVIQTSRRTAAIGDQGNSNFIEIWEKNSTDKEFPAAMVLLLDIGGENFKNLEYEDLYDAPARKDTPLSRLLYGDGRFNPGIDGAILVEPAVSTGPDTSIEAIAKELNQALNLGPLAFVYTCADKLIAAEAKRTERTAPPLLTQDTFPNTTYTDEHISLLARHFLPERIRERIVIQEEIASRVKRPGYKFVGELCRTEYRGFLVCSCRPYLEDGEEKNDYTQQFNVADPIIWMLNQLKLFPIRVNGGTKL